VRNSMMKERFWSRAISEQVGLKGLFCECTEDSPSVHSVHVQEIGRRY